MPGLNDPLGKLDREIDNLVKHMVKLQINGAHISLVNGERSTEIVYVWDNKKLEKEYSDCAELVKHLTQERLKYINGNK